MLWILSINFCRDGSFILISSVLEKFMQLGVFLTPENVGFILLHINLSIKNVSWKSSAGRISEFQKFFLIADGKIQQV